MALPIALSDIEFGERDALHEFMKQDRQQLNILDQSFVVPPRIKMSDLQNGARYLIAGPKGSGKTTLLWHLKRSSDGKSKIILFKSDLLKEDRDKLDRMVDLIVVEDQKKYKIESDYKAIWEWYLLKNIFSLIDTNDVSEDKSLLSDIKSLLNIKETRINNIFDSFFVEKVKGKIKLSIGTDLLKSELSGEVEARRDNDKIDFLDLIRLIQSVMPKIKLNSNVKIRIYIDELEFFMSKDGDGERDHRLVRDLVFSIYKTNNMLSYLGFNIVIIASLRSEIFNSIATNNQEVEKILDAFGVNINWHEEDANSHPVLGIFENKIRFSEIESCGYSSEDVWLTYFPTSVGFKDIKGYLLDLGLHRPRGVLLRLKAALDVSTRRHTFHESDFVGSEDNFGRYMLQEFNDELSASHDEFERENLLSLVRGHHYAFDVEEIERRKSSLANKELGSSRFYGKISGEYVVRLFYRIGLIGNQFENSSGNEKLIREQWSFRGYEDPVLAQRFVLHKSIRKALQTF
ncbi:hypothetical protein OVA03_07820 [Asticcacaulis sp. SL142]|uniref:P-loop ATPase, Sll1717 family n=1 Tax=Asticcacaulis sp. SL142 TaxID=2995155 RepID=UPI00226D3F40|nr:hypothetical protein [Asticcacaulis sp. SL142]WAC49796.1 hypothetical protein OVA03_07820 [Asticcacaulis sp. SL142]